MVSDMPASILAGGIYFEVQAQIFVTDNFPGTFVVFSFMMSNQERISTYVDPVRKIFNCKVSFKCHCQYAL